MIVIEFFGGPGVGKTTVAHASIEQLRATGRAVDVMTSRLTTEVVKGTFAELSRLSKYTQYLLVILQNIKLLWFVYRNLSATITSADARRYKWRCMWAVVVMRTAHKTLADCVVLDRGFLNALVMYCKYAKIEPEQCERIVQTLYASDDILVCWLQADVTTAVERTRSRVAKRDYIETLPNAAAYADWSERERLIVKTWSVLLEASASVLQAQTENQTPIAIAMEIRDKCDTMHALV